MATLCVSGTLFFAQDNTTFTMYTVQKFIRKVLVLV